MREITLIEANEQVLVDVADTVESRGFEHIIRSLELMGIHFRCKAASEVDTTTLCAGSKEIPTTARDLFAEAHAVEAAAKFLRKVKGGELAVYAAIQAEA